MKKIRYTLLVWIGLGLTALAQVTPSPRVEEAASRYVTITRVELTDRYTIIDMLFKAPSLGGGAFRMLPRQATSSISIDPQSRLYAPGRVERRFAFVKAEDIPVAPRRLEVYPGDEVAFRLYYERLDPGVEIFDFFEGRNPGQTEFWNFYGVHIRNPKKAAPSKPVPPAPPVAPLAPKTEPPSPPTAPDLADDVQPLRRLGALPEAEKPALLALQGTVYDAKTRQPIAATLAYAEADDTLRLSTRSGKYRLGLLADQAYQVQVSAKGYLTETFAVSPADSTGALLTRAVFLTPLAVGESIALRRIFFETGKYELLRESFAELDGLAELMLGTPTLHIRVEGHTDAVGDFDKNLELSRQRAAAVKAYLVQKGIAEGRIEAQGYGSTRPLSKKASEEARQQNRRVELVIVKI